MVPKRTVYLMVLFFVSTLYLSYMYSWREFNTNDIFTFDKNQNINLTLNMCIRGVKNDSSGPFDILSDNSTINLNVNTQYNGYNTYYEYQCAPSYNTENGDTTNYISATVQLYFEEV